MMVSEIPLQCSRVILSPEGIRQDFPLEGNIFKFYNPFERLTVLFFAIWGYFYQPFTLCLKINIVGVSLKMASFVSFSMIFKPLIMSSLL